MDGKSLEWYVGFGVGILIVIIVVALIKGLARRRGETPGEYDERQQANRGVAHQRAYMTLLFALLVNAVVCGVLERQWAKPGVDAFVCIFISIGVFIVNCILRDAYFTVNQTPRRYLWIIGAVIACQIPTTVMNAVEGNFVEDGLLTVSILPPATLILFGIVLITLLIKLRRDKAEEDV